MLYGYAGKILRVNLSTSVITTEDLPEDFCTQYLGGNGFGARLLYSAVQPKADPLGEANPLIFATGPLNGAMVPMASKFCVVSKSPYRHVYGRLLQWKIRFRVEVCRL
jgi:aldehyde:ferredoxin oxidoreductase